jgi:hypothetical protein
MHSIQYIVIRNVMLKCRHVSIATARVELSAFVIMLAGLIVKDVP